MQPEAARPAVEYKNPLTPTSSAVSSSFPSPTTSPNDRIHQRQLPHFIHHLHQLPKTTSISRNGTKGSTKGNLARLWHLGASQSHSNPSRRPHPPVARHQLARLLLLRRRRPARRPPPHLATRRSAPRPERRPTLRTSTRVCFLTSIHLAHPDSKSHFDFKSILSHLNLYFCPFTDASFLSPQAGTPRHRYLQPRHVHPQLFRERHLRACRNRGIQARCIQQEVDNLIARNPNICATDPAR